MSVIQISQSVSTWLTYIAIDVGTDAPRTGITFGQIDVSYKKSPDVSFTPKALITGEWREIGLGVYEISFSAVELDTLGSFIFVVNSNGTLVAPATKQHIGLGQVVATAAYTPGTISLSTNVLTGNLVDLVGAGIAGEAVSARILSAPSVMGASPNIGGVGTDVISAETDVNGFFALEVLQGAVIDIVIPVTGYRRTLTVPANSTDSLFDIS